MPNRKHKPFKISGHRVASALAARAEDAIKAGDHDRLDALARETSYQQAGSKEAFLHQLAVLRHTCEHVADEATVPEVMFDLPENPELVRLVAMQMRLIESLAVYAEHVTGVDREQTAMSYYLGQGLREPCSMRHPCATDFPLTRENPGNAGNSR